MYPSECALLIIFLRKQSLYPCASANFPKLFCVKETDGCCPHSTMSEKSIVVLAFLFFLLPFVFKKKKSVLVLLKFDSNPALTSAIFIFLIPLRSLITFFVFFFFQRFFLCGFHSRRLRVCCTCTDSVLCSTNICGLHWRKEIQTQEHRCAPVRVETRHRGAVQCTRGRTLYVASATCRRQRSSACQQRQRLARRRDQNQTAKASGGW